MFNITDLTPAQLRHAADIKEKINELQAEFNEILGVTTQKPAKYRLTGVKSGRFHTNGHTNLSSLPKEARNGHKKLHWTQTPEGRERCRQNVLNRQKRKEKSGFAQPKGRKNLTHV